MKALPWMALAYQWRRLDGFLQLALALALLNVLVALLVLPRQDQALAALEQEATYLSGQRASANVAAEQPGDRYFPPADNVSQVLRQIDAIATRHQLFIERSGGKFVPIGTDGSLQPFQLDLRMMGEYHALRGFVDDLLRELPYVAVADLALNRKSPDDVELLMPVRLRIFLTP